MLNNKMNVRLVRNSEGFDNSTMNKVLMESKGPVAIISAKSILSTEIIKILQPLVGTKWSPNSICKDIMNNIQLELFIGVNDSSILESLLYNEFYKIALEVATFSGVDATGDVVRVIDKLKPIINSILLLLSNV